MSISPALDPGLGSPVYKDYQRSFVQERDRDMYVDRSINEDNYNLFSCLSRSVITGHVFYANY
jgi:hypothetical protein